MPTKKIKSDNKLISWIFNKPAIFALLLILCVPVCGILIGAISSALDISDNHLYVSGVAIGILSLILPTYYLIKKLPNDDMHRNDFIAITNAISLVTILFLILVVGFNVYKNTYAQSLYFAHIHPLLSYFTLGILTFITSYLIGIVFTSFIAKYKRCRKMGIDWWKIILSLPFGFLMLWGPGYLIPERNAKSNLVIKSKWYSRFNNWVVASFSNTLVVFLLFILIGTLNLQSLLINFGILIIYALWYTKHKSDFVKNINHGYAITAVLINIILVAANLIAM